MAGKLLVSIVAIGVAGAGAVIFQDEIQTALFDPDKFVACFKNEVLADIQVEDAMDVLRGKSVGLVSAEVLGPTLESLGYTIAKSVKRNGFTSELEEAKSEKSAFTITRLETYDETGQLPEKSTKALTADAIVECLECGRRR